MKRQELLDKVFYSLCYQDIEDFFIRRYGRQPSEDELDLIAEEFSSHNDMDWELNMQVLIDNLIDEGDIEV